jgi:hypothetical protein
MSLLSRLFGKKPDAPEKPGSAEDYKDFRITPKPIREGGQYRVAARIEKVVNGTAKTHELIRSDTMASLDEATTFSLAKSRQMIDEQGDKLFGV